ncbi:hypothetical protein L914_12089 [Phytophthora nicotianae]|uniref:DDE Tnp4 domain-containing protein n=1 Tax=Phytophthora nicotianae TaxID=4792 RepID=W2N0M4_PHYNI|nr:hypothetical protein L914_12089 [Phytophthora nicotianae]
MIFHLFGPVEGCRHDIVLLRKPELGNRIRGDERFRGLFIYGDQAYGRTDVFVSPFKGALTPAQAVINSSMPEVRTTVEWSYGQVINYWGGVDFKRKNVSWWSSSCDVVQDSGGANKLHNDCSRRQQQQQIFWRGTPFTTGVFYD